MGCCGEAGLAFWAKAMPHAEDTNSGEAKRSRNRILNFRRWIPPFRMVIPVTREHRGGQAGTPHSSTPFLLDSARRSDCAVRLSHLLDALALPQAFRHMCCLLGESTTPEWETIALAISGSEQFSF